MNAVIEKPRARRAGKQAATLPPTPNPTASTGEALTRLSSLLDRAWMTDDPEQDSGDSNRLLSSARYIVSDLQSDCSDPQKFERGLYDVAAQVKAALLVPGDTPSAERTTLIEQIGVILSGLLDDPSVLQNWAPDVAPDAKAPPNHPPLVTQSRLRKDWSALIWEPQGQETFLRVVWYRLGEATAVIRAAAEQVDSAAAWGVVSILGMASKAPEKAWPAPNCEMCDEISNYLCQALSILALILEDETDALLDAGLTLLIVAKAILDEGRKGL